MYRNIYKNIYVYTNKKLEEGKAKSFLKFMTFF